MATNRPGEERPESPKVPETDRSRERPTSDTEGGSLAVEEDVGTEGGGTEPATDPEAQRRMPRSDLGDLPA